MVARLVSSVGAVSDPTCARPQRTTERVLTHTRYKHNVFVFALYFAAADQHHTVNCVDL